MLVEIIASLAIGLATVLALLLGIGMRERRGRRLGRTRNAATLRGVDSPRARPDPDRTGGDASP